MNRDPQAWARLGVALRQERVRAGLTQADLAERAGVSIAAVGDAEKGKVPRARMPYTLEKIAAALGWPAGTIESVLDGGDPPGGWAQAEQRGGTVEARLFESVMTHAMVTATDHATSSEIRAAVNIAIDELRRHGVISETDGVQPNVTK